jgi:hypothetical protein
LLLVFIAPWVGSTIIEKREDYYIRNSESFGGKRIFLKISKERQIKKMSKHLVWPVGAFIPIFEIVVVII